MSKHSKRTREYLKAEAKRAVSTELQRQASNLPVLRNTATQEIQFQQTSFSGPLPHPEILAGYQSISPDFPKLLAEIAKDEQVQRHRAKERRHWQNERFFWGGQISGLLALFAFLGFAMHLIDEGHEAIGSSFAAVDFAAIIGMFLRKSPPKKEPPPKSDE